MTPQAIPRLHKINSVWELTVDGSPFLLRAAELHNSSMSSASYMSPIWARLADMGVNTVLGAVSWADVEPVEGHFDFGELDAILEGARAHGLRLVILWFGSFKNGMSSYVPEWVATNPKRFPRMLRKEAGERVRTVNAISVFAGEGAACDAAAFRALMSHLRDVDGPHRTVIMVQVENEVGLLGDSRDRSASADVAFQSPLPAKLLALLSQEWDKLHPKLQKNFPNLPETLRKLEVGGDRDDDPSWACVLGDGPPAEELFMAYHYALYVEKVASAGREEYPLPMFANAWIPNPPSKTEPVAGDGTVSGGGQPGEYPSGGPTPSVLDIWSRFAPSLDFLAPDIYIADHAEMLAAYSHEGQPLFVPEQRRDEHGARRLWEAIGTYGALGVSPFGIDSLLGRDSPFYRHYKLLASVSAIVIQARRRPESMFGFFLDDMMDANEAPLVRRFSAYELTITRALVFGKPGPAFGLVIELAPDRFLFIGAGYRVTFASTAEPAPALTAVLRAEEKRVVDAELGLLETERRLNGDETHAHSWVNMPDEDPDYGDSFLPVLFPARTMIAEATVHSLHKAEG